MRPIGLISIRFECDYGLLASIRFSTLPQDNLPDRHVSPPQRQSVWRSGLIVASFECTVSSDGSAASERHRAHSYGGISTAGAVSTRQLCYAGGHGAFSSRCRCRAAVRLTTRLMAVHSVAWPNRDGHVSPSSLPRHPFRLLCFSPNDCRQTRLLCRQSPCWSIDSLCR